MPTTLHTFENGTALAAALADKVAGVLSAAIAARGKATLAVSGGSTPKAFFKALSGCPVDWSNVTVTLVDERYVPADDPRSNHKLVRENLLTGKAAAATFMPLYHEAANAAEGAVVASAETASVIERPFDAAILGMGTDGHTASFFPGGDNLATALAADTPRGVIAMQAEGAGEPRVTFTFSALQDAELLVLHIEGDGKMTVLKKAEEDGAEEDMPIRAILRRAASPVEIYWAP
jgi:6-phosphogluconolactonase